MKVWFVASIVLTNIAFCQEKDGKREIPVEGVDLRTDLEELEHGTSIFNLVPRRNIGLEPLRIGNNNLFHALFGFPEPASAVALEEGRVRLVLNSEYYTGKLDDITNDVFFSYDAKLLKRNLMFAFGMSDGLELFISADYSELAEGDDDIVLARSGSPLIAEGSRSADFGNAILGFKKEIWHNRFGGTLSVSATMKIPLSSKKENLLSSGGIDNTLALLYTHEFSESIQLHFNIGFLAAQESTVFAKQVKFATPAFASLGVGFRFSSWLAAIAQFQGNESIFKKSESSVEVLDQAVYTASIGFRFRIGSYMFEAGAGKGFGDASSDSLMTAGIIFYF